MFFSYTFEHFFSEGSTVEISKRTDEDIFLLRESLLSKFPHVSWSRKHLEFAFEDNLLIARLNGGILGYLHFEKYAQNVIIDEICVDKKRLKNVLDGVCAFFETKTIKVESYYPESCCKKNKGMIYYKFDGIKNKSIKNPFYLGVNLE